MKGTIPGQKALQLALFGMPRTALLFDVRELGRFDQADEGRLGAEQAEQVPPDEASPAPAVQTDSPAGASGPIEGWCGEARRPGRERYCRTWGTSSPVPRSPRR